MQSEQANKEKVYVHDDGGPTYLDGVQCQYSVMRGAGERVYLDETVAYVFEKEDAELIAAALSANAPAAGSGPSDAEIMAIAKKMVPAFAEWPASCVDFARALLAQYGGAAWQPIETAPHETNVLLSWVDWDGKWQFEVGQASWGWSTPAVSNRSCHGRATHWMPLPPAPQEGK